MKRRNALKLLLLGGITATSIPGIKWVQQRKAPDLSFLSSQEELLAELAETIIPSTDTPGAKAAKVHEFIMKMVKDCTDVVSQNNFINGLKDIEDYCQENYSTGFISCSNTQKEEVLTYFEQKGSGYGGILGKIQNKISGRPFFNLLKEYTVIGYCTSEIGATQALDYDYIPGNYITSFPLQPSQKSWALK